MVHQPLSPRRIELGVSGLADAGIGRDVDGPLTGTNTASHRESTVWSGERILVDVHPWHRLGLLTVGNHQFPKPASDEQLM